MGMDQTRNRLVGLMFQNDYSWLSGRLRRYLGCPHSAEDIASETFLKVLALRLTNSAELEVRRAKLLRQLPPEKLEDVFPTYPDDGVMALPAFSKAYRGLNFPPPDRRAEADMFERTVPLC